MPTTRPSQPRDLVFHTLPRAKRIMVSAYDKPSIRATVRFLQIRWEQGALACQSKEEQQQLHEFLRREQVVVIG